MTDGDPVTAPIAVQKSTGVGDAVGVDDETLLRADGIGVRASWGHIFGPTDVTIRRGGVTVLVGSGGRGRTALLLTLAGRMRPSSGQLHAFGKVNNAQHLFSRSAVAWIDEVDGIQQTIRVRDVITEQIRWAAKWYKWVGRATPDDMERICRPVFGPYSLPDIDDYVEELPELTAAMLRIAVANIRKPPLLVVGGIDRLTRIDSAQKLLDRLAALGEQQTVITADVNGTFPDAHVRDVIEVHNLTDNEFVQLETEDRV
ncbi:ATP-binding cassette domain-containing protein [Gordonia sputi]|uniref:ATP-binding cassette domain-containing protein n=1 Tax=Gordonia sputi TaxID=36823 RepID=UPI0020439D07|nr:ATP-binding cassette domain-containing protein [Gordonia sputi]MCM3897764.1 ATP-binding cassette domain-containing protein [Gordonia sputi]